MVFGSLHLKSAYHQIKNPDEDKAFTEFKACGNLFCQIPFDATKQYFVLVDGNQSNYHSGISDSFTYLNNIIICGEGERQHCGNVSPFYAGAKKCEPMFIDSKNTIRVKLIRLLGSKVSYRWAKLDSDRTVEQSVTGRTLKYTKVYTIQQNPERLESLLNPPLSRDLKPQMRVLGFFEQYFQKMLNYSGKIQSLTSDRTFYLSKRIAASHQSLKDELP